VESVRILVVSLLVGAVLIATGCGSASPSAYPRESLIPLGQVDGVFYRGTYPRRIGGLIPLLNLQSHLPYGDLEEYGLYSTKSPGRAGPRNGVALVTVFGSVRAAREASLAIAHGGECVPHPQQGLIAAWAKCEHRRVRNVLLIMSLKGYVDPGISVRDRWALVNAFRKLGRPTYA
jgi:hypothetical protein